MGIILLTKSTIGMGLLMNQFYFSKSGYILSSIITFILCILIAYSFNVLLHIANMNEKHNSKIHLENLD